MAPPFSPADHSPNYIRPVLPPVLPSYLHQDPKQIHLPSIIHLGMVRQDRFDLGPYEVHPVSPGPMNGSPHAPPSILASSDDNDDDDDDASSHSSFMPDSDPEVDELVSDTDDQTASDIGPQTNAKPRLAERARPMPIPDPPVTLRASQYNNLPPRMQRLTLHSANFEAHQQASLQATLPLSGNVVHATQRRGKGRPPKKPAPSLDSSESDIESDGDKHMNCPEPARGTDNRWKCPASRCEHTFNRRADAVRHYDALHTPLIHRCHVCGKHYSRNDSLVRHQREAKCVPDPGKQKQKR